MKSISKLGLVLFFCQLPLLLVAQEPVEPVQEEEVELEEEDRFSWRPVALRLGVDVSRLAASLLEEDTRFFEVNGDLQFGRYLLAADWGTGRQLRPADAFDYRVNGNYFRIGADVNLIPDNADNNALFVGLRYGRSWYGEELATSYSEPYFGGLPVTIDREASARWLEGVAGMKARVWEGLFLGYTLRYKFALKTKNTGTFASYEVPGFGRVDDGNTFAFNYHLFYYIPF